MGDIVIRGLCKRYGEKRVLDGFDMTLPAGKIAGLTAPSGAGKTTLLRLIAGLEAPDAGTIVGIDGLRLGVVFQEDRLLDWLDAVENIRLTAPGLGREAVVMELDRFGIADSAAQPVSELSGGMRRRVALLRALMSPADLLLLDEPFNGLDPATKGAVIRETLRLIDGRTALVISHDPREAEALGAVMITM